MKLVFIGLFLSLIFLNVSDTLAEVNSNEASKKDKAANFTLEDQFGKKISINFPSDKVAVLVFGDRKGSEQVEGWVRPLYGKYTDKIYIFGIAELSVVPWAVRPAVRMMIRRGSKTPVMLDWSGNVSKSYGYEKGKANVFVVGKDGSITAVKRGAASNAALNDLYQEISAIL
jgi:peroxiredoxin